MMEEVNLEGISQAEYLRQRLEPRFGDPDYIHLSDLLIALQPFASDEALVILDYGCGGSPYRALFPNSSYRRADFEAIEGLDYVIGHDSRIEEQSETFDLILSTQVAEHVTEPLTYFAECFRLLKPGGKLICTTHGTFPDHGCPYDFQRWTADGLKRDLRKVGFSPESTHKLTTNARGLMYLIQRFSGWFETRAKVSDAFFRFVRVGMHRSSARWQKVADKAFPDNRVVSADDSDAEFYLGLLVVARR